MFTLRPPERISSLLQKLIWLAECQHEIREHFSFTKQLLKAALAPS